MATVTTAPRTASSATPNALTAGQLPKWAS
jgi:hypothetical protein